MTTRAKFVAVDTALNFFLFTPLVLLFWYGTYILIDIVILSQFESRLIGATITLLIGVFIEFDVTYWQDAFGWRGRQYTGISFLLFSRLYNYILAVANICHYRAIQEFYDVFMASDDGEPAGLMTAVQTAVTSIVLLWSLRAGRNITALPFALSVDTDYEGWFGAPVLYGSPATKTVQHFFDTLVTVLVVWTLGPLHWITLGYVFDKTIYPDDFEWSMIVSCVLGYLAVIASWSVQEKVRQMSQAYEQQNRTTLKTLLEDVYIFGSTAAVILTWKGVGMAVDQLARQFPIEYGGYDYTGLCANVMSFVLLSLCYVSCSLVGKGAEMDGGGVSFSTDYFTHFFADYITEKDKASSIDPNKKFK